MASHLLSTLLTPFRGGFTRPTWHKVLILLEGTRLSRGHRTVTAALDLGKDAQRVGVLAVSVEPKRDTVAAALAFSKAHHMTNYWHFLVGTEAQLSPVWTAYAIGAQQVTATASMHTTALYIIDKQGCERTFLDQTFTPAQLTGILQTLLKS